MYQCLYILHEQKLFKCLKGRQQTKDLNNMLPEDLHAIPSTVRQFLLDNLFLFLQVEYISIDEKDSPWLKATHMCTLVTNASGRLILEDNQTNKKQQGFISSSLFFTPRSLGYGLSQKFYAESCKLTPRC